MFQKARLERGGPFAVHLRNQCPSAHGPTCVAGDDGISTIASSRLDKAPR